MAALIGNIGPFDEKSEKFSDYAVFAIIARMLCGNHLNSVSTASHSYIQQFPVAFKDTTGILPGKKAHLTVEGRATPVVHCACTLPEARRDDVKAEA